MKYEVGDRVRIVSTWPKYAQFSHAKEMNRWLGKSMTIRCIDDGYKIWMEEDRHEINCNERPGWVWCREWIAGYADDDVKPADLLSLI